MRLVIPGRPIPYKRTTQKQKWVDKSYHKYRDYKTLVQEYIQTCLNKAEIEPYKDSKVQVSVIVYLHGGGAFEMGRDGDIDNYIKSALDSMNGYVFKDDRQVISVKGEKRPVDTKEEQRMEILVGHYEYLDFY